MRKCQSKSGTNERRKREREREREEAGNSGSNRLLEVRDNGIRREERRETAGKAGERYGSSNINVPAERRNGDIR